MNLPMSDTSGHSGAGEPSSFARPHLSPLAAWALAFGCAVGWGSFVMPGTTFLPKAGPLGTVIGMVVGGLVMAVIAWNYHVMMTRNPGPGGAYTYATKAFGIDHGFLCAWFLILAYVAIVWANATALAIVAHYTLGDVFKFGFHYHVAGFDVWMGDIILAAIAIIVAAEFCVHRCLARGVQTILAVGFALGILLCFVSALIRHEGGFAEMTPAFSNLDRSVGPLGQILRIVALSPWLFVGFESISHASGEFTFPLKRSFRVMAAALITSVLAYALLAVLPALVPIEGTAGWSDYIGKLGEKTGDLALPTFAAVKRALGPTGVVLIGLTMFGAIFTGLVGNLFAASRLLATMADDGILPARVGRRNADGSPQGAVLAIAEISILIPFLGRTAIGFIVDVSTIGAAIAYAYTSAAAWRLARGYPTRIAGICGVVLSAIVLVLFIVPNFASGTMMATESYLILVLWCIIGFVVFRDIFRHDERQRFGKSTIVWVALLFLVTFMSLMWMRQVTGDMTRYAIDDIERIHEQVFPDANHEADAVWDASLREEQHVIGVALTRGSLVQTGLMFIAFIILFNLYAILRQRERDSEREKTRAKSYFFSTVSHDIRTPLNAIIGFSEMLKEGFKTEEEHAQAVDAILVSSKTLLALVNDVLDLSKLESGRMAIKPVPIDCARELDRVFEVFKVANKNPQLDMRLKVETMPLLLLDPQRLRQVCFNLISNAVKFTEKGFIEVRASFKQNEVSPSGTFTLVIEDTGCGIPPEDLESITSAYVQIGSKTARNGGTGLGLAICRQLAEAVGGKLAIVSEVGKGSCFTITLPDVASGGPVPAHSERVHGAPASGEAGKTPPGGSAATPLKEGGGAKSGSAVTPPKEGGGAMSGSAATPPKEGDEAKSGTAVTPPKEGGGAKSGSAVTPPKEGGGAMSGSAATPPKEGDEAKSGSAAPQKTEGDKTKEKSPTQRVDAPVSKNLPPSLRGDAPEGQGGVPQPSSTAESGRTSAPAARILLVDDSTMNLVVLKALLKKAGNFEIITAMDGNEALAALKAPDAAPFDLVLTDMWMPNLDGEGLVKAIRADPALSSLKVIVVTADVELKGKSEGMGFDDIILKPVTPAVLNGVLPGGK